MTPAPVKVHPMKIILISGSGRSGSTILSLLLTQGTDIFNIGQIRDFWRAYKNNAMCSCGVCLSDCPFWSKAMSGVVVSKMGRMMAEFRKATGTLTDWNDTNAIGVLAKEHARFLEKFGDFLSVVKDLAKADTLLDLSKSPDIALAFNMIQGLDTRIINLVRDPRAVAVSWEKKMGEKAARKYSNVWAHRQYALTGISEALGDRFRLLRYEDLMATPRVSIEQLLAWSQLQSVPGLFTTDTHADISWTRQHLYAPMNEKVLRQKLTSIDVSAADDWRKPEHAATRNTVETLIPGFMEQFGYHVG